MDRSFYSPTPSGPDEGNTREKEQTNNLESSHRGVSTLRQRLGLIREASGAIDLCAMGSAALWLDHGIGPCIVAPRAMASSTFQALPGFRDFTPRECAVRNYLFETWRRVARRCGYVEYETPILEDTGLYLKKSGGELSSQLFRFEDQGGRDVTLRPEVTASLARIAAAEQRQYPKPLKWFEIGQCFRYEKPQKGRGREFHQFNVDILGEAGPGADAELIALAIETMLSFGFVAGDFVVRVSDRNAWLKFAEDKGVADEAISDFLGLVDKLDREKPEVMADKLASFGMTLEEVKAFVANPENASAAYEEIKADLTARGLGRFRGARSLHCPWPCLLYRDRLRGL